MFQKECLGSTCFFLRGREPHIRLLACREERQTQSILALDAGAFVLCRHSEQKPCVRRKRARSQTLLRRRLRKAEGSMPGLSPVLLQECRLLTAETPPSKDGLTSALLRKKKKKENHTSFIKKEEKLKTGPGGTTLSSQLLGNLRARGL